MSKDNSGPNYSKKKHKWVSGFVVFIGEDGKTYKGEIVRVNEFNVQESYFSGQIEGVVEEAKYQDKPLKP